ncbi:MAG: alkaline phosphatase [Woeseiaceae bacterium]
MTRNFLVPVTTWLLLGLCGCDGADSTADINGRPNLILIIGDGFDDQQITIARNYLVGSGGELLLDQLPYRGMVQVQAIREDNPNEPNYVADSAATATTMASGVVTSRQRVGTTAKTDEDVASMLETAQAVGLRTGIVTTASVTDATPASFVAHVSHRFCHGPENMVEQGVRLSSATTDCSADYKKNGGRGSIAEQIASSKLDIVVGGGSRYFGQMTEGNSDKTVLQEAEGFGFRTITDREALLSTQPNERILGLFSASTMPVRYRGENGGEADFLKRVDGKVEWPEPFSCEINPNAAAMPTLREMTETALRHLENQDGFALVIEAASIDKQAHDRNPCGSIGEVEQLIESLQAAISFQQAHPNTLILVTADHGHSATLVPDISGLAELEYGSPGRFARIKTPEGGIMGINYASNDSPMWDEHSGVAVPLYAIGPGVDDLPHFIRQSEIHTISLRHLGLSTP